MEEFFIELLNGFISLVGLLLSNIFAVFFIFLFILPMLARRGRNADLVRVFSKLQKKRSSRIITLVHRLEPMGFLGLARFGYIDLNDAEEIIEAIRSTPPDKPLEIMMHTPGGLVLAALQIARAVKAHPGPTKVYIPHFAMSGGTMIALAADEIVMTDHAIMGPVDPQIDGWPAAAFVRIKNDKSIDAISDQTLLLADMSEMAINQVRNAARELLSGTVSENAANSIAEQLATGKWTHDYPIYAHEARDMGLNVSTAMPDDFMTLMGMFPNTVSQQSGVRYLSEALFGKRKAAASVGRRPLSGTGAMPAQNAPSGRPGGDDLIAPAFDAAPGRDVNRVSYGPWNPRELRARGHYVPERSGK